MSSINFSINVYSEDHKRLKLVLDNVHQEVEHHSHIGIQVIVLDAAGSKKSAKIAEEYELQDKMSIQYVNCKGLSIAEAYNKSKSFWTGDYINFITEDMKYEEGAFHQLENFIHKHESRLVCLTPNLINAKDQAKGYLKFGKRNFIVDLTMKTYHLNMNLNSYFIAREGIKGKTFREDLAHQSLVDMLLRLLKDGPYYGIVRKRIFSYNVLETDYYNYPDQFYKTWYTKDLEEFIIPTLQNATYDYEKYAMLYLIMIKFACNMNDRYKAVILNEELDEFFDKVKEALQYIPDNIISQYEVELKRVLPRYMGLNLLRMKYDDYDLTTEVGMIQVLNASHKSNLDEDDNQDDGEEQEVEYKVSYVQEGKKNKPAVNELLAGTYKGTIIEEFSNIQLYVKAINYEDGNLVIDGEASNVYFLDYDQIKITAEINGVVYTGVRNEIYSLVKYFKQSVRKGYHFTLIIPVDTLTTTVKFGINLEYQGHVQPLNVKFKKIQARLYEKFRESYWCFGNHILKYHNKDWHFVITKKNPLRVLKNEFEYTLGYLKYGDERSRSLKCMALRLVYWITRPYFYKKQIWLTFDQLFKGGDNGEYFYRYVSERKDKGNIRIYYVINKTAPEYKRLKEKYGTVLAFNSFWHKLISLHATMVFATRVDVKLYCGYWAAVEKYVRDLFNAEITCLQHGLTIQRIAQYQNRLFDNTKLYFCVSPYEVENLSHPVYGYKPEQLVLTGAPRYDGLISNDQRYILISPTWRRNVTAGTNKKGSMHEYSENFKYTEYFRIYNTLINDKRLIEAAKENNYRIKYLIHPILSPQIRDFDTNDYVDIIAGAGDISYEKMLTEASLMLTDHSGIQFDFANMRKPLVYFHPDTLPPQYDEGGLKYDTMGFGPVCVNTEEVIAELCEYMKNNCQLKEKYRERIDKFFAFNDTNNCERVYEAALEYLSRK